MKKFLIRFVKVCVAIAVIGLVVEAGYEQHNRTLQIGQQAAQQNAAEIERQQFAAVFGVQPPKSDQELQRAVYIVLGHLQVLQAVVDAQSRLQNQPIPGWDLKLRAANTRYATASELALKFGFNPGHKVELHDPILNKLAKTEAVMRNALPASVGKPGNGARILNGYRESKTKKLK